MFASALRRAAQRAASSGKLATAGASALGFAAATAAASSIAIAGEAEHGLALPQYA